GVAGGNVVDDLGSIFGGTQPDDVIVRGDDGEEHVFSDLTETVLYVHSNDKEDDFDDRCDPFSNADPSLAHKSRSKTPPVVVTYSASTRTHRLYHLTIRTVKEESSLGAMCHSNSNTNSSHSSQQQSRKSSFSRSESAAALDRVMTEAENGQIALQVMKDRQMKSVVRLKLAYTWEQGPQATSVFIGHNTKRNKVIWLFHQDQRLLTGYELNPKSCSSSSSKPTPLSVTRKYEYAAISAVPIHATRPSHQYDVLILRPD
ncbi:hypothetical protein HK102_012890, partial [Quaeritorhiza haematococci]